MYLQKVQMRNNRYHILFYKGLSGRNYTCRPIIGRLSPGSAIEPIHNVPSDCEFWVYDIRVGGVPSLYRDRGDSSPWRQRPQTYQPWLRLAETAAVFNCSDGFIHAHSITSPLIGLTRQPYDCCCYIGNWCRFRHTSSSFPWPIRPIIHFICRNCLWCFGDSQAYISANCQYSTSGLVKLGLVRAKLKVDI